MQPASNNGAGMNMGTPDPCGTPPSGAPVPYPNTAQNSMALPVLVNVMFSNLPAQNMTCKTPTTLGDNAGTMSPFMGPGGLTIGSPVVQVNGMGAAHLTLPSYGNNYVNGIGTKQVPSSTNVLITCRPEAGASGWTPAALATLPDLLLEPRGAVRAALADGLGILQIARFALTTPRALLASLSHLRARGARALLIDLRGNPGGALASALRCARALLRAGEPRLALLVDRHTASAAEVFAACLQDHGRAVVIGERSFGKGLAQRVTLGPASATITWEGHVWRPSGAPLQGLGVRPDVRASAPESAFAAQRILRG